MLTMIRDDVGQALDDAADIQDVTGIQDVALAVSVVLCESLSLFFVVTRDSFVRSVCVAPSSDALYILVGPLA
ncbi:MAG: hypothetical protein FWC56_02585 [Phycisphaerae bacterium]|nr:hypothetical protein [Phycisphaerae bacterium]